MEKYKIEISTNAKEVIEFIFLEGAKVFNKYGASFSAKNEATKKIIEDNSEKLE